MRECGSNRFRILIAALQNKKDEKMHENKVRVLVVEDEASIRRFITLNLEMAGYEIGEAVERGGR